MATASKLANLGPAPDEPEKEPKVSGFRKSNIEADFSNMDDEVTDQGQAKDHIFESRSIHDKSYDGEIKDSCTFKPGFLANNHQPDPSSIPMSFGMNMLSEKKNTDHFDDF